MQLLLIATTGQILRNGTAIGRFLNLFSIVKSLKLNGYQPMTKNKCLLYEIVEAKNYTTLNNNKMINIIKKNPFTY